MEFKDRLKTRMDDLGLRQTDLSARTKVSKATVSFWLAGTNRAKGKNLLSLAEVLQCSPTWLETGQGNPSGIESNVSGSPMPLKGGTVPVIGMAKLGTNGYFEAIEYPTGHSDGYVQIHSSDPDAYAYKIIGDSMEPRIRSGEYVLIEPGSPYESGDEVLVEFNDGLTVKKMLVVFIFERDGLCRFISINSSHPPVTIDRDQILSIYPIGAIIKASRFIAG